MKNSVFIFIRKFLLNKTNIYGYSLLYSLLFIFTILNCATTSENSAFKISTDRFRESTHNLLIVPLEIPNGLEISESGIKNFEIILETVLEKAGFKVFSTQSWRNIYNKQVVDSGGLYDPITGKLDEKKSKSIFHSTLTEVRKEFKFDAILFSIIFIDSADWFGGTATWKGASEDIILKEDAFFEALRLFSGTTTYGKVGAISLHISIYGPDDNGELYYSETSGIQVLAKIRNDRFYTVPSNLLLTDIVKNKRAILTVLSPLIKSYTFHNKK